VKRARKTKGGGPTRRPLTEQALLDAYKPFADSYLMSFPGCSTPEQIEDTIMSNPEQLLPLVMGIGGFPGGAGTDSREFLELPRVRRFLTGLYVVAHHGRKGDWRAHAAKDLLTKLMPKRKGGSPTDLRENVRGTFSYAFRDAKSVLTPKCKRFVMQRLKALTNIPEMSEGKFGFQSCLEFVRCLLQKAIGYGYSVTDEHIRYLHQCAVRHAPIMQSVRIAARSEHQSNGTRSMVFLYVPLANAPSRLGDSEQLSWTSCCFSQSRMSWASCWAS
jgi:hypothetical protein